MVLERNKLLLDHFLAARREASGKTLKEVSKKRIKMHQRLRGPTNPNVWEDVSSPWGQRVGIYNDVDKVARS